MKLGLPSRPGGSTLRPPALLGAALLAGLLAAGLFFFWSEIGGSRVASTGHEPQMPPRGAEHAPAAAELDGGHALGVEDAIQGRAESAPSSPEAASPETPERELSLRGRVVDSLSKPVGGARVFGLPRAGFVGVPFENLDPAEVPWSQRAETIADDEGRFSLEHGVRGDLRLGVRARGFAPYERQVPRDFRGEFGAIVLERGAFLEGHVRDASGRPVAGAVLRRLDAEASTAQPHGGTRGVAVATTDERGAFRVEELRWGPWELLVTSAAHPDQIERGVTRAPGEVVTGLEFVLEPGAEIQGHVVGAPPPALAELWVQAAAEPDGGGSDSVAAHEAPRQTRCAADGSFTVRGLAPGAAYRLSAGTKDLRWAERAQRTWVEARAGDRGVVLHYEPRTALVFQVVDVVSGEPVTELEVRFGQRYLLPLQGEGGQAQRSFPGGRVLFENLLGLAPGERGELRVEALGYEELRLAGLELAEGQTLDLGVLGLVRAPTITVLVVDESGAPVADALVTLLEETPVDGAAPSPPGAASESFVEHTQTDVDGRARLNALAGRATLVVRHEAFAPFDAELLAYGAADLEETVRLRVGRTQLVEVVDEHGAPVPGVRIQHQGPSAELAGAPLSAARWSDPRGTQRFEHLEEGVHRFRTDGRPWVEVTVTAEGGEALRLPPPAAEADAER